MIRSHRAPAFLALTIGVCLALGGLGVAVVDRGPAEPLALETRSAAPTVPPTTADPTTTVAQAPEPATAPTPAPSTTRASHPTTTTARPTTTVPRQAAPGVEFTAPAPSSPSAPAPSPVPPAAAGDSLTTVGTPAPAPPSPGSTSYAFLAESADGEPARWNPCVTIHYAVNVTDAPPGALALVKEAAARMAAATGTTWVFDGTTTEVPTSEWGYGPSDSFPTGWQPLLIGFSTPERSDLLDGDNAGAAFPVTLEFVATGELVHVSGAVVIDADTAAKVPMDFGGASVGSVVLHEMAHAYGLGHVPDPSQIMNPVVGPWTPETWGAGDREGLRQLGRASGCTRTAPPAPWG